LSPRLPCVRGAGFEHSEKTEGLSINIDEKCYGYFVSYNPSVTAVELAVPPPRWGPRKSKIFGVLCTGEARSVITDIHKQQNFYIFIVLPVYFCSSAIAFTEPRHYGGGFLYKKDALMGASYVFY